MTRSGTIDVCKKLSGVSLAACKIYFEREREGEGEVASRNHSYGPQTRYYGE